MTRLGTLRVTAPPPSPPHNSPPNSATPALSCIPQTPSTATPNPSPHPSPPTPTPTQPPISIRQPPLSKNLRWTAVALVSKLSKELERPSSAIADEVALAASHDMRTRFPEKDVAPVERNTRRRVYDALKVMVAVGCIQRHGKHLRWIGVDHLRYLKANNSPNIRVSLCESRRRIGRKKAILSDMRRTITAFDTLYSRHLREYQWRTQHPKPPTPSRPIQFPMVVVNAQHPQVAYSPDRKRVRVTTQAPFKVYSETDLVTMLADRTALKRPKIAKKRRPARGIAASSYSPDPKRYASSTHVANSSQPHNRNLPRQSSTNPNGSDAASKRSGPNTRQNCATSNQDTSIKKDRSRRRQNDTNPPSTSSTDSRPRPPAQCDRNVVKVEPQLVPQDKEESEETTMTDTGDTPPPTGLPQQVVIYNNPAASGQSAKHDGRDLGNIGPSATGTQEGRDVSTAPLICDEELGIPPLDDGDSSSLGSDDDPMIGWKTGEDGDDFEHVFRAPIFHEV